MYDPGMRRVALVGCFVVAVLAVVLTADVGTLGRTGEAQVPLTTGSQDRRTQTPVGAPSSADPVLLNQYGDEVQRGVSGPPPLARPGDGTQSPSDPVRMHVVRNRQLWTVQAPVRTESGLSTPRNADEFVNAQLPQMWRCGAEIQTGCWSGPGTSPGNPSIPDSAHP
jgi:hypothetical protein